MLGALRTQRDRAIVLAMLLAGCAAARCWVCGYGTSTRASGGVHRLREGRPGADRAGLGPVLRGAGRVSGERAPLEVLTDACFVVLKGSRRGMQLTAAGLDEVIDGVRERAGLARLTCHMLRHTCFTRLREQGMSLEALQAQAGHASIESTRIYLHLANDWLVGEYMRAAEAIEAQADPTETDGEAA